jgi:hypothetical protein
VGQTLRWWDCQISNSRGDDAVRSLVTDDLVEAVHRDCCSFSVPGAAALEKLRIRRVLEAAAPRLVAALEGQPVDPA